MGVPNDFELNQYKNGSSYWKRRIAGYLFPSIRKITVCAMFIVFITSCIVTSQLFNKSLSFLSPNPPLDRLRDHFSKIEVIVNFNEPRYYSNIPALMDLYQPVFGDRLRFYGKTAQVLYNVKAVNQTNLLGPTEHDYWWFVYKSLLAGMTDYPDADGWLYISDDTFMDVWALASLNRSRIWYQPPQFVAEINGEVASGWWWATVWSQCSAAISKFNSSWHERLNDAAIASGLEPPSSSSQKFQAVLGSFADFIYVPKRLRSEIIQGLTIMASEGCFLEVAVASVAYAVEPHTDFEKLNSLYLWDDDRNHVADLLVQNGNVQVVHPTKLSDNSMKRFLERYLYRRVIPDS